MTELLLTGAAVAAGWAVSLYFWPFGQCGKCKGSGRNLGSNKKRFGTCKRCKGSGRRQRFGSRAIHKSMKKGK